jgi:hypothetical protein
LHPNNCYDQHHTLENKISKQNNDRNKMYGNEQEHDNVGPKYQFEYFNQIVRNTNVVIITIIIIINIS